MPRQLSVQQRREIANKCGRGWPIATIAGEYGIGSQRVYRVWAETEHERREEIELEFEEMSARYILMQDELETQRSRAAALETSFDGITRRRSCIGGGVLKNGSMQTEQNQITSEDRAQETLELKREIANAKYVMLEQKDDISHCEAELEDTRAEVRKLKKIIRGMEKDLQKQDRDMIRISDNLRVKERSLEQARIHVQELRNLPVRRR